MNLLLLYRIKCLPKNTNGRLAIPALAGLLVISFVKECVNIVLHMVAVIDQRVIKCRLIGEFSWRRPIILNDNFSVSLDHEMCVRA